MAKLSNLSRGFNNRVDPTKLDDNITPVYITNADISSGSVVTIKAETQIRDSIVQQRVSGHLFFVSYGSPKAPAINHPTPSVTQQSDTVIYTAPDNSKDPPIPEKVELNIAALPNVTNLRSNLGPRGIANEGQAGDRTGKFLGVWNVAKTVGVQPDNSRPSFTENATPAESNIAPGFVAFSNGKIFYSVRPLESTLSPYRASPDGNVIIGQDDTNPPNPLHVPIFSTEGPITLVLKTPGLDEQIFSGTIKKLPSNIDGGQYLEVDFGTETEAVTRAFNLRQGTLEIWGTSSLQRWSLTVPPLNEDQEDQLWITYVKFNDDNTASFTTPQAISVAAAPLPSASIVKQPNITLTATGLPANTTSISGYLYLNRPLTEYTVITSTAFGDDVRITGSVVSGSLQWLRMSNVFDPNYFRIHPSVRLTIGADIYDFEPEVVDIQGRDVTLRATTSTTIGNQTLNLRTGFTIESRILGTTSGAPVATGASYDSASDMFTMPRNGAGDFWQLDPDIRVNYETWRLAVVLNESGAPTIGTPIKVYDGSLIREQEARETLIRVPAAPSRMSIDRPLPIVVGADINQLKSVTPYFHRKDGIWYFGDGERDYAEYRNELFFTKAEDVPGYIKENGEEELMGIPQPNAEGITITGSTAPAAWNPVVRQINTPQSFPEIDNFAVATHPFSGFDQSRITRTFDTNVGGHEIYNSIITTEPGKEGLPIIEHLDIILAVGTTDATLINVGNVYCNNFKFQVVYGSGGGGHRRPAPIARINGTQFYQMGLLGGTYHSPIWGSLAIRRSAVKVGDSNRTVTINNLPKPIPAGNTLAIDWRVVGTGSGTDVLYNYRLGAFTDDKLIRTHDFTISTDTNKTEFIISDTGSEGWTYKLYRGHRAQPSDPLVYYEVIDFLRSTSDFERNLIKEDTYNTDITGNSTIGAVSNTPPVFITADTQYAITNVNETEQLESVPAVVEAEITNNAFVKLTNIPTTNDPRVEYRYIYKIDSVYPNWGYAGKIKPNDTEFEDNVSFSQSNIYIYRAVIGTAAPAIPDTIIRNSDEANSTDPLRKPGQWDGTNFTPPTGWTRERPEAQDGENVYRSRVELLATANPNDNTKSIYTSKYGVPEPVDTGSLLIRTGETLNSITNWPPENGLQYLTVYNNTFFGVNGSVLWFSRYGYPHYWPRQNFIEFDNPITGLLSIQQGLLVFTRFQTHLLQALTPTDFTVNLISAEQGCVNHKTAVFVKGTPVWVSDDGIVSYQNGRVNVISREFIGENEVYQINWADVRNAVYWKDIYHVLLGGNNAPESGESYRFDNRVLCLDNRYFLKMYMCDGLDPEIQELPQRLGRFDDNKLYMVTRASNRTEDYKLWELGTNSRKYLDAVWESQRLTDGTEGLRKTYNEVFLTYEGQLEVETLIDGISIQKVITPVYNPNIPSSESNKPVYNMGLDKGRNSGYTIQFKIRALGGTTPSKFTSLSYEPVFVKDDARRGATS